MMKPTHTKHLVFGLFAAVVAAAPVRAEVTAQVTAGERSRTMTLIRVDGDQLIYRLPDAPSGVSASLRIGDIAECEFEVRYDDGAVQASVAERRWLRAAEPILKAVGPCLPFLSLPENNAARPLLDAGVYLTREADARMMDGGGDAVKQARALYEKAATVFRRVAEASWFPMAGTARLRATWCLIEIGRFDDAAAELAACRVPERGDADYGLYWLVTGMLAEAREDLVAAADAAVQSVCFENKDTGSFPDALLLQARTYEKMGNFYRARDIYYETARLFARTEWGAEAVRGLASIMDAGHTREPEPNAVTSIFFGDENMNEKADELLRAAAGRASKDAESP